MSKKRAFVRYTKSGKIVPGSLIITTNGGYPDKSSLWQEVTVDKCCPDSGGECEQFTIDFFINLDEVVFPIIAYQFAFGGPDCSNSLFSRVDLNIDSNVVINDENELLNSLNLVAANYGDWSISVNGYRRIRLVTSCFFSNLKTCMAIDNMFNTIPGSEILGISNSLFEKNN
jgi:hypothetical protein